MKYWTDPFSQIPNRTLLETRFAGGFRHGSEKNKEQKSFDRWWRQRISEIIRDR